MKNAEISILDGALVVDKPTGISSHDVVQAVRRALGERSIGHLGTLDPFASGVLVLLVGPATRLARFFNTREKAYEGTICFGYSTDTMDCTGVPVGLRSERLPSADDLRGVFSELTGTRAQTPPPFSAKKVGGTPAYRLARSGRAVFLAPVDITVHELRLVAMDGAMARFYARVSSGTYLRALAHEAGEMLGTGAHLASLRRTAVGEFTEECSVPLDNVERRFSRGSLSLIPAGELLPEIPAVALDDQQVARVLHGGEIEVAGQSAECVRLLEAGGRLCAIARRVAENLYHPSVVLHAAS